MTILQIILLYAVAFPAFFYFLIIGARKYPKLMFLIYLLIVLGLMLALFLAPVAQIDNQKLTHYQIFSGYNRGSFAFYYLPIMFLLYLANLLAGISYFIKPSSKIYYFSFILMLTALLWIFTLGILQQLALMEKIGALSIDKNIGILMMFHFAAAAIILMSMRAESNLNRV